MSKITICHATGSATNSYVSITVDTASAAQGEGGHGRSGVNHGDIIPPFTYNGVSYPGQGDQAVLANGCQPVSTTTTTTVIPSRAAVMNPEQPSATPPPSTGVPASGQVTGASTIHTGMPFAGSTPYDAAAFGLGLMMLAAGLWRRMVVRGRSV